MTHPIPVPRVIHGNCIDAMRSMPAASVDFILTDPPYITRYRDRHGRTVANDDNSTWLDRSFAEMHRVLRPHAYAVSFYGWPKIDLFAAAWHRAGFRIGGHLVFRKRYTTKTALVKYQHEQAFLLVKGNPPPPKSPPPDVLDWDYTGNRLHPTQKPLTVLKPLVRAFSHRGQHVLDPFAGSGSTLIAASALGRHATGIELDAAHVATMHARIDAFTARNSEQRRAA